KLLLLLLLLLTTLSLGSHSPSRLMTQQPPVVSKRQGETLELSCGVNQVNWFFYWYRQQPGEPKLQYFGTFSTYSSDLEDDTKSSLDSRLSGKRKGNETTLYLKDLQLSDTGLYLCASKDTVTVAASVTKTSPFADENCQRSQPTVHLLGPVCHKDHVTLVCVAQGFPYEWPIDVSWKRDAQEVTRLSFATDPVRTLNGTCNFGVSSRLSMTAAEWQERHVYSCHVRQGNIAEAEEPTLAPSRFPSTIQSVGADL
uniref:Ig-like domain-containing protein n=1 Tax=Podarcis muralis TaxID=64176 RepID=A0A670HQN7_PODMU